LRGGILFKIHQNRIPFASPPGTGKKKCGRDVKDGQEFSFTGKMPAPKVITS
jgi:hypothetical protein